MLVVIRVSRSIDVDDVIGTFGENAGNASGNNHSN